MNKTLKQKMGKIYIASTVGLVVVLLLVAKFFIHKFGFDFIVLNTLVGSIVAGSTFITGFLLAAVLADYKEVEKIPSEIRSSFESILSEGEALDRKGTGFDSRRIKEVIKKFVYEFQEGLSEAKDHSHLDHAIEAIAELDPIFDDMESLGVPPNYMTRIKTEQAHLRKLLLRVAYIQKTRFVPSVSVLVQSIVPLVIFVLLFAEADLYTGMIELGLLSYLLIYTMNLIHVLEKPFRKGKDDTCDDVSIFLLRELASNMDKK